MRRTQLRQSEVVVDISLIFHVLMMSDGAKRPAPCSFCAVPQNTQSCTPEKKFPFDDEGRNATKCLIVIVDCQASKYFVQVQVQAYKNCTTSTSSR